MKALCDRATSHHRSFNIERSREQPYTNRSRSMQPAQRLESALRDLERTDSNEVARRGASHQNRTNRSGTLRMISHVIIRALSFAPNIRLFTRQCVDLPCRRIEPDDAPRAESLQQQVAFHPNLHAAAAGFVRHFVIRCWTARVSVPTRCARTPAIRDHPENRPDRWRRSGRRADPAPCEHIHRASAGCRIPVRVVRDDRLHPL